MAETILSTKAEESAKRGIRTINVDGVDVEVPTLPKLQDALIEGAALKIERLASANKIADMQSRLGETVDPIDPSIIADAESATRTIEAIRILRESDPAASGGFADSVREGIFGASESAIGRLIRGKVREAIFGIVLGNVPMNRIAEMLTEATILDGIKVDSPESIRARVAAILSATIEASVDVIAPNFSDGAVFAVRATMAKVDGATVATILRQMSEKRTRVEVCTDGIAECDARIAELEAIIADEASDDAAKAEASAELLTVQTERSAYADRLVAIQAKADAPKAPKAPKATVNTNADIPNPPTTEGEESPDLPAPASDKAGKAAGKHK